MLFIDISLENSLGSTAHFYTVNWFTWSSIDILKLLVEAGTDLTKQDKNGYNILHLAAYFCSYEMAKYLIDDNGMDKKVKTYNDGTALDLAKSSKCKDYVDNWKTFRKLLHPWFRG